jgi:hypothetical protein
MAECWNGNGAALGELAAFCRNHYFYGKLLDVHHLEMEQTYFNHKRWMMNRLTLGSGVLCGLDVRITHEGQVRITPGVAIDAAGREIVVPREIEVDPRQLTDGCCRRTGERAQGAVLICLAYHECESDLVPVLVGECETERDCAPSTICERFCVILQPDGQIPAQSPACSLELDAVGFDDGVLSLAGYRQLLERVNRPCPTVDGQTCVPLARVDVENLSAPPDLDVRPLVYSNTLLFELLLCLWARVEECCGGEVQADPPRLVSVSFHGPQVPHVPIWLEPLDEITILPAGQSYNSIEMTFSKSINFDSVATFVDASEELEEVSLMVLMQATGDRVKGTVESGDEMTIRFVTDAQDAFAVGEYEVTLRGNADEGQVITDTEGMIIDGDPHPEHPNKLPSGDGTPGGDFQFRFEVQDLI